MRRQDRIQAAECRRQERHPGQAQWAEEEGGQGWGDKGHQRWAARRRQHEEDGVEQGAGGRGAAVGGPVQVRPRQQEGEAWWNIRELIFKQEKIGNFIQVGQNVYWGANSQKETENQVQGGVTKAAQVW